MTEQTLFQDNNILVTSTMLKYGSNYYPIASIKSVVYFKESFDVKGFLINVVVALAGLYGLFTFKTIWVILGLVAVGIGGFNVYNMYDEIKNPTYIVAVEFHNAESLYIKTKNGSWAKNLHDILHSALQNI